jgi:manganese transport protein
MLDKITAFFNEHEITSQRAREFLRYLGPGILVTVGFIDPGNWASNMAAGAEYGFTLLWVVTLSTFMLIVLQHNAAHLGIVSGQCLSEGATKFLPCWLSRLILTTAMLASAATVMAELLGGAIALNMLFKLPLVLGALLLAALVLYLLFTNSYNKLEKIIVAFVSLIGLSFLAELALVKVEWVSAGTGWVVPQIPHGALLIVCSVLGAVVMPHNLFLHSEVIQSRQWNKEDEKVIARQLQYEFLDTIVSMGIGWAINSAMIIIAAVVFFQNGLGVTDLQQAVVMLRPILGDYAAVLFAIALLLSGVASTTTACMAAGSIFAGMGGEAYDIADKHSRIGVILAIVGALILILVLNDPFQGLIYSQMALSMQLPMTIGLQLYLTSSKKVMGKYANSTRSKILLSIIGIFVVVLNLFLIKDMLN